MTPDHSQTDTAVPQPRWSVHDGPPVAAKNSIRIRRSSAETSGSGVCARALDRPVAPTRSTAASATSPAPHALKRKRFIIANCMLQLSAEPDHKVIVALQVTQDVTRPKLP